MADDADFHKVVAESCVKQYRSLPSKGKPVIAKEWTPLAGVVQKDCRSNMKVVALGTGSKCIGSNALSHQGWRVNDSHAEILARRSFRRYLLYQIKGFIEGNDSIITRDKDRFKIVNGTSFHFFCTQTPCGDASIFPNDRHVAITSTLALSNRKRNHDIPDKECATKKSKRTFDETSIDNIEQESPILVPDIHRTGAKSVITGTDPKLPGNRYHCVGVLRTKPGRGDPTRSMSCSDKLMRWNYMGCQGALLGHYLIEPVYFSTMTFGDSVYDSEAVKRALITRLTGCEPLEQFTIGKPSLGLVEMYQWEEFVEKKDKKILHTASIWCSPDCYEVMVLGLKQGSNTKSIPNKKSSVSICKRRFLEEFNELVKATPTSMVPPSLQGLKIAETSYHHLKQASESYQSAKIRFNLHFPSWLTNEHIYEDFKLVDK